MIPRETIDRIYAAARIEDVVQDYVTLRRRGANLIGLCPFHDEKTGSFTVSPAKGIYKCFGCGKAGNVVNFVMDYEQIGYADALRQLARRYQISIKEIELTDEQREQQTERESMFILNDWAKQWFEKQLWETNEGQNVGLSYFYSRGLREDIIRKFSLGYSPERSALYDAAIRSGYKSEFLEKTGLCGKSEKGYYDRFRDRVIFPIHTVSGKIVAFAGRILKKNDKVGKYVNSPDSAIYSKQNELYGLFLAKQAITKQQQCYLVEGQMDVIAMHQAGIENVVSSGGTALTHRQVTLLHRFTENVTVLYDGDAAGIHAALRGIDMLLEEGIKVKVVLLPDGEDPDSFSKRMNANEFVSYIESHRQDFIRFKIELLLKESAGDPQKRSQVVRDILQSVSVIPDNVTRQVYTKLCGELLSIDERAIIKDINEIRRKRKDDYIKQKQEQERREQLKTETSNDVEQTNQNPDHNQPDNAQPQDLASIRQIETTPILTTNIRNLLQVLMRYGDRVLYENENQRLTVGQYIINDLQENEITFSDKLYDSVLREFVAHENDEGFRADLFFQHHPNGQISALAVELIPEPVQLSKLYGKTNVSENVQTIQKLPSDEDRLQDLVPQLLMELKLGLVNEQIKEIRLKMHKAQAENNEQELQSLFNFLIPLDQWRKMLNKQLGNRVVT